jgi:ABC-type Fe3+/spermidine/putrescine transport system ATPase subunit
MAFLEINDIHKQYEGEPLLRDLSLEIERGEIVTFLGPSGSGKTTLLRIIAGLEPTEAGSVILEGESLARIPTHERGIVLMFQEYALFPHRTVAENVAFGLKMRGLNRTDIQSRVEDMLGLVGLQEFSSRNVVELSGGERQRVALARSLAPEPRLLLLDEPLGSLDRTLKERLLEELAEILRRVGVTTITVTHDQAEAFALADRVALLHEGVFVQAGEPEEVFCNPVSPWAARFMGLTNLFSAKVVGDGVVECPLGRLRFDDGAELPPSGASGTLLILPWGIHLGGDDHAGANAFTAEVTRRIFEGRITRFVLTFDVKQPAEASVSPPALRLILEMGTPMPEVGETVTGRIDASGLRWL